MGTAIGKDVPAYVTVSGSPAEREQSMLRACGGEVFDTAIAELRRAFKVVYRQGLTLDVALERLAEMAADVPEVQPLIDSLSNRSAVSFADE